MSTISLSVNNSESSPDCNLYKTSSSNEELSVYSLLPILNLPPLGVCLNLSVKAFPSCVSSSSIEYLSPHSIHSPRFSFVSFLFLNILKSSRSILPLWFLSIFFCLPINLSANSSISKSSKSLSGNNIPKLSSWNILC